MRTNQKQTISEMEMRKIYLSNLRKKYSDKFLIFQEVKNFQKRIDIVTIQKYKNNKLGPAHGVELKVKNWRNGLIQTKRNRSLIPFNSLAIWEDYKNKINKEELINNGIGLIIVSKNKNLKEINPKRSKSLIKSTYQKIRHNLLKNIN